MPATWVLSAAATVIIGQALRLAAGCGRLARSGQRLTVNG
jgi:hypothetical protein